MDHPDYRQIDDALNTLKARVDAPESHGILCGMLSTGAFVRGRDWLSQIAEERPDDAGGCDSLQALYESTQWQLQDTQFSFQPLLPDDEANLRTRTEALAHWCSGFLFGLGIGGVTEATQLPSEAAEVLGDIAKIASVDFEVDEPGEAEENAYQEVLEYVRVGTLLVFESLRGPQHDESVH